MTARIPDNWGRLLCTKCKRLKIAKLFAIDRSKICGRQQWCRSCWSQRKRQHCIVEYEIKVITDMRQIEKAIVKEGWVVKGYWNRLLIKLLERRGTWFSIRCENNYYQHSSIENAIRRNARAISEKVWILHGDNEVFVKLRT